ncbi:Kinesin-like protein kif19 [Phytophthora boehmeriae]|uniref:Kinesin-like protein n=1 Tax=Phytophthora boehmeriae TaxID=109152 RepID=A0A8T1W9F5_9STRA|nr:Kinesin-like protein kif19 [Phytophthora boehmeriae]
MSVVQNSDLSVTSRDSSPPLFQLSSVALRPMTSHARIEGGALYSSEIADSRPTPQKNFLPQLLPKLKSGSKGSKKSDDGVDTDSDTYRQKMWAGQANILVTVRLRPLLSHDRDRVEIVKAVDNKEIIVLTRRLTVIDSAHSPIRRRQTIHQVRKPRFAPNAVHSSSNQHSGVRSREKRYAFDYVFSPQDGQEAVYQHTTKFLIHGVLNGFNATVFAYGCTGAGKTYTMLGTHEKPGIMAKTLEDLFRHIERAHADPASRVQYRVTVSFLEVYNENIRDLLAASGSCSSASSMPTAEFLDLREDPIRGPVVAGLSEVEAHNAKDVMKLLRKGNKYRSQEATAANAVSSRSHAVLQVQVEQQENADSEFGEPGSGGENDGVEVKFGKLSLVDLAGSERAAVTQNRGQRLLEGANINRSLLALGNCINALGEKAAANVSLAASSVEETLNTLKYANRAKNIKTTVRINTIESDLTITNQSSLVANLQEEIATLKKALLQQQNELSDIERIPKSNQRWVDSKNSSTDCNDDDNNNQDDDWKNAKLREARQYITETFEERRRLHHALLKLEHQVRQWFFV